MRIIAAMAVVGVSVGCLGEAKQAPTVGYWSPPDDERFKYQFFFDHDGLGVSFQKSAEGLCHVYLRFEAGRNKGRQFVIRGVDQSVCADTEFKP